MNRRDFERFLAHCNVNLDTGHELYTEIVPLMNDARHYGVSGTHAQFIKMLAHYQEHHREQGEMCCCVEILHDEKGK